MKIKKYQNASGSLNKNYPDYVMQYFWNGDKEGFEKAKLEFDNYYGSYLPEVKITASKPTESKTQDWTSEYDVNSDNKKYEQAHQAESLKIASAVSNKMNEVGNAIGTTALMGGMTIPALASSPVAFAGGMVGGLLGAKATDKIVDWSTDGKYKTWADWAVDTADTKYINHNIAEMLNPGALVGGTVGGVYAKPSITTIKSVPYKAKTFISGKLDNRFQNVILPEHLKAVSWVNEEIFPNRIGRKLTEDELKTLIKNVDRYHFTGDQKIPLKYWLMTGGVALDDGTILYNPLFRKSKVGGFAAHETTHQLLIKGPAHHDVKVLVEHNPITNDFYYKRELPGPYRKAYINDSLTGAPILGANYHPDTGLPLKLDFNPKTDLHIKVKDGDLHFSPKMKDVNVNGLEYEFVGDPTKPFGKPIDAVRLETLSKAFPVYHIKQGFFAGKPFGIPEAKLPIEKDASVVQMLYDISNKYNNAKGTNLTTIIKHLPDEELRNLMSRTNGYTKTYLYGIKQNKQNTPELYDLIRSALLLRKQGGSIHIKEKNKGSFTKYCKGRVTEECIRKGKNSPNPKIRKKATFAANARKWKHLNGGIINYLNIFK